ncbi:hypothetical protein F4824DRAFT_502227 [Ustulina deusta]|nr:hypothetical protein F4824DRAFT_502227 [Ustulina deusta]
MACGSYGIASRKDRRGYQLRLIGRRDGGILYETRELGRIAIAMSKSGVKHVETSKILCERSSMESSYSTSAAAPPSAPAAQVCRGRRSTVLDRPVSADWLNTEFLSILRTSTNMPSPGETDVACRSRFVQGRDAENGEVTSAGLCREKRDCQPDCARQAAEKAKRRPKLQRYDIQSRRQGSRGEPTRLYGKCRQYCRYGDFLAIAWRGVDRGLNR